jgi:hypothetical protein
MADRLKLRKLAQDLDWLEEHGRLTYESWSNIYRQAEAAAGTGIDSEALELFHLSAEPGWLQHYAAERQTPTDTSRSVSK